MSHCIILVQILDIHFHVRMTVGSFHCCVGRYHVFCGTSFCRCDESCFWRRQQYHANVSSLCSAGYLSGDTLWEKDLMRWGSRKASQVCCLHRYVWDREKTDSVSDWWDWRVVERGILLKVVAWSGKPSLTSDYALEDWQGHLDRWSMDVNMCRWISNSRIVCRSEFWVVPGSWGSTLNTIAGLWWRVSWRFGCLFQSWVNGGDDKNSVEEASPTTVQLSCTEAVSDVKSSIWSWRKN